MGGERKSWPFTTVESTKFRGFICPSRMRESSAMDTHVHNISTKLENIYEASRKMNEKSVAKAL